jgi:phosphatidylserine decarboxylase
MIRSFMSRLLVLDRLQFRRLGVRFVSKSRGARDDRTSSVKWKKWTPLPVGVGFAYIAYQQYGHVVERQEKQLGVTREQKPFKPWQVSIYKSLPLRWESRLWGWLAQIELPVFLRAPLIGLFAKAVGCDLTEAEQQDLTKYVSLNEFFRRDVKQELRPLANSLLVSPSDGVVQVCGQLVNDRIEQVKGFSYTLAAFVGQDLAKELKNRRKRSSDDQLYYCVIYLSPADCHKFYSPVQWKIDLRRHITGYLLSVNKKALARVPDLFSINERVLLTGEWEHGFFSMTPVGATHVGSIILGCETTLRTNLSSKRIGDVDDKHYDSAVQKSRGDYVGEFNMGSSVVLIFEAPKEFKFAMKPGDKLRYGQTLGTL